MKNNPARQQLTETAMRLFRQQGYASVGLNQIVAESGVPKGSLYHYFPEGKASLGVAAVQLAGEKIAELLNELARKHRSPQRFVRGFCEQMAVWMEESGFQDGSPTATVVLETVPESKEIQTAARIAMDSWVSIVSAVLQRDDLDESTARKKALGLVAAVEGALVVARVYESREPLMVVAKEFY